MLTALKRALTKEMASWHTKAFSVKLQCLFAVFPTQNCCQELSSDLLKSSKHQGEKLRQAGLLNPRKLTAAAAANRKDTLSFVWRACLFREVVLHSLPETAQEELSTGGVEASAHQPHPQTLPSTGICSEQPQNFPDEELPLSSTALPCTCIQPLVQPIWSPSAI